MIRRLSLVGYGKGGCCGCNGAKEDDKDSKEIVWGRPFSLQVRWGLKTGVWGKSKLMRSNEPLERLAITPH